MLLCATGNSAAAYSPPALGVVDHFDQFPGAADRALRTDSTLWVAIRPEPKVDERALTFEVDDMARHLAVADVK